VLLLGNELVREMLDFIGRSPTCFHAAENVRRTLLAAGYTELHEWEKWELKKGGKYFASRNGSCLAAFRLPAGDFTGFQMAAGHGDSPSFKLKENPVLPGEDFTRLDAEPYGGMLMATWLDRPLSLAGRVLARGDGAIVQKLVDLDRDLLVIPNVAVHMNRELGAGAKYDAHVDLIPLLGGPDAKDALWPLVAEAAGVKPEDVAGHDLFLYNRAPGTLLGARDEYIGSPRLDDLECVYGCLRGFLAAKESGSAPVFLLFDNEEVGSGSKQGAGSTFLPDLLHRICACAGRTDEEYRAAVARSFLVSADNAHARHPNHPEYADAENFPRLNGGVVVKYSASQRYTTDGVSSALFRELCKKAGVPAQSFANRSDLRGGSTLGNIANSQVSLNTVDVGLAQLAMHSSFETAGAEDPAYLVKAMTAFYETSLTVTKDGFRL
jgi:aspartyl aminopeptidase